MTSILLDCPECGAEAEARVHIVDGADAARELLEYVCSEGCEGTVVVEMWEASDELVGASSDAHGHRELARHVA
jgi:hypothetical protein